MSHVRRPLTLLVLIAALAAVAPATASAGTSSPARVTTQVAKSDVALARLQRAVNSGRTRVARRQLLLARRHAATASQAARRLLRSADTPAETALAAGPLALAAAQYDELVAAVAALVDEVTGKLQTLVAQALPASLAGREQLLALLNSIVDDVPEALRPTITAVIAALSGGAAPEVGSLTEALGTGNLPSAIGDIVQKALALAQTAVTHALDLVKGLLPQLPEAGQNPLGGLLTNITGLVGGMLPSFLDGLDGLIQRLLGLKPA